MCEAASCLARACVCACACVFAGQGAQRGKATTQAFCTTTTTTATNPPHPSFRAREPILEGERKRERAKEREKEGKKCIGKDAIFGSLVALLFFCVLIHTYQTHTNTPCGGAGAVPASDCTVFHHSPPLPTQLQRKQSKSLQKKWRQPIQRNLCLLRKRRSPTITRKLCVCVCVSECEKHRFLAHTNAHIVVHTRAHTHTITKKESNGERTKAPKKVRCACVCVCVCT